MAGMYGTIKPADIDIENDVEIFYYYRPSYNVDDTNFSNFKKLEASSMLAPCQGEGDGNTVSISGLFNLKLPMDKFGRKGIYNIYIRPKERKVTIKNVGVLAAYQDVRGVVFSLDDLSLFKQNNSLVGYRIEYTDGSNKTGDFKIITSSNLAEEISAKLQSTSDKTNAYRYTMSGNMIFCTVTPSLAPTFKPNDFPSIGYGGQNVVLVNTKFNPVMIELEMVEHDDETITYMLEGNQLIDKDKALVTTFNPRGEIYHQSEYGTFKDEYGNPLYEFKKQKDNIDFNQNIENLE